MEFIDLKSQQSRVRFEIDEKIREVLKHGRYVMGPEIKELEKKLADYVNVKYTVGVASGTDALLMALMAYDIGPGDAVFTTPFTFIATAEVIQLLGATPVFVDIDSDTFNINPDLLEKVIAETKSDGKLKLKGIIPVDLFGQPADYNQIDKIAKKYDLFVLEDAAQSFGALYKGERTCSLTEIATTSFFPAKPFGCYGDGGMVFCKTEELYEKLLSLRVHGAGKNKYDNVRIGINGRIDTIQAAILLVKFSIFEDELNLRQKIAARYSKGLMNSVKIPRIKEYNISSWAQYSVCHEKRDQIVDMLKKDGIPTAIYYPIPLHLQTAFSHLGYKKGNFPVSESAADQIFSLPMHPYLTLSEQERIIECVNKGSV